MEDNSQIAHRPVRSRMVPVRQEMWTEPYQEARPPIFETHRGAARFGVILRRHRVGVCVVCALCILASVLVTLLSPPVYKAKILLEVMAVNQDFMNSKDIDPYAAAASQDAYIETQTKLMTSDTITDRVIAAMLAKTSSPGYATEEGSTKLRRLLHLTPDRPETTEAIVRKSVGQIKVKAEGTSSLISVTAYGPTPKFAADVANSLAGEYIASLQEARWSTASTTGVFLNRQLQELKNRLQSSEDQLQAYARTVGLAYSSDSTHESVAGEKLRQIQQDLEKAEADTVDKQSQLEQAQTSSTDTVPRVLDDGSLRANNDKIIDLKRQLAELRTTLKPTHYKVKQVESQIAELEAEQDHARSNVIKRIQNDYRAAQRRQALLTQAYDKQAALVSHQSSEEVRYNMLKSEVDANREIYQSMLQKVKEAGVVAAMRASNLRIVDPAKLPGAPSQPNKVVNLGIGALAGCLLSVLFILIRERQDHSIRAPGESAKLLDLPELATIPSGKQGRSAGMRLQPGSGGNKAISDWAEGESLVAESFRSAVTSILLWARNTGQHRIILVASPHAKAGKTTTVLNLGMRLAESGRRVLLIDGDLRRPSLGEIFGFERAAGFGDVLAMELNSGVAKDLVRESAFPGLFVLPSGTTRRNIPQLLHSLRLETLLDELRADFDFVLIDTPPMVPMTDARLLGQHADGVILICRAGQTSPDQLAAARKSFSQDSTPVIGTILNYWDARAEDPAYGQSYSRYYKDGDRFKNLTKRLVGTFSGKQ